MSSPGFCSWRRRATWWLTVAFLLGESLHAAIAVGDPEQKVVQELGAPTGVMTAGSRKRLSYPHGVITLVEGKVSALDDKMAAWLQTRAEGGVISEPPPSAVPPVKAPEPKAPAPKMSNAAALALTPGPTVQWPLSERMFASASGYFSGPMRQAWAAELQKDKEENGDPAANATYPAGSQKAFLYVPKGYDGTKPVGLYIDVRPENVGLLPPGYDVVCNDQRMIWVSAHGSGNDQSTARRCALALDALATAKKSFRIDERRIFVGGFSGGGAVASRLLVLYPDQFRGAVISARGVYLQPVRTEDRRVWPSHFPFLKPEDFRAVSGRGLRVAFVSGANDFNYPHVMRCVPQWNELGFTAKAYDIPGMPHMDAPPDAFATALGWVDGKR